MAVPISAGPSSSAAHASSFAMAESSNATSPPFALPPRLSPSRTQAATSAPLSTLSMSFANRGRTQADVAAWLREQRRSMRRRAGEGDEEETDAATASTTESSDIEDYDSSTTGDEENEAPRGRAPSFGLPPPFLSQSTDVGGQDATGADPTTHRHSTGPGMSISMPSGTASGRAGAGAMGIKGGGIKAAPEEYDVAMSFKLMQLEARDAEIRRKREMKEEKRKKETLRGRVGVLGDEAVEREEEAEEEERRRRQVRESTGKGDSKVRKSNLPTARPPTPPPSKLSKPSSGPSASSTKPSSVLRSSGAGMSTTAASGPSASPTSSQAPNGREKRVMFAEKAQTRDANGVTIVVDEDGGGETGEEQLPDEHQGALFELDEDLHEENEVLTEEEEHVLSSTPPSDRTIGEEDEDDDIESLEEEEIDSLPGATLASQSANPGTTPSQTVKTDASLPRAGVVSFQPSSSRTQSGRRNSTTIVGSLSQTIAAVAAGASAHASRNAHDATTTAPLTSDYDPVPDTTGALARQRSPTRRSEGIVNDALSSSRERSRSRPRSNNATSAVGRSQAADAELRLSGLLASDAPSHRNMWSGRRRREFTDGLARVGRERSDDKDDGGFGWGWGRRGSRESDEQDASDFAYARSLPIAIAPGAGRPVTNILASRDSDTAMENNNGSTPVPAVSHNIAASAIPVSGTTRQSTAYTTTTRETSGFEREPKTSLPQNERMMVPPLFRRSASGQLAPRPVRKPPRSPASGSFGFVGLPAIKESSKAGSVGVSSSAETAAPAPSAASAGSKTGEEAMAGDASGLPKSLSAFTVPERSPSKSASRVVDDGLRSLTGVQGARAAPLNDDPHRVPSPPSKA